MSLILLCLGIIKFSQQCCNIESSRKSKGCPAANRRSSSSFIPFISLISEETVAKHITPIKHSNRQQQVVKHTSTLFLTLFFSQWNLLHWQQPALQHSCLPVLIYTLNPKVSSHLFKVGIVRWTACQIQCHPHMLQTCQVLLTYSYPSSSVGEWRFITCRMLCLSAYSFYCRPSLTNTSCPTKEAELLKKRQTLL